MIKLDGLPVVYAVWAVVKHALGWCGGATSSCPGS